MEEATNSEENLEVHDSSARLEEVDRLSATLVAAVALDVHHSLELVIQGLDIDQDAISKTVHLQVGPGKRSLGGGGWRYRRCKINKLT